MTKGGHDRPSPLSPSEQERLIKLKQLKHFSSIVCCVAPYAFWYQRPSERRIRTQCASYIVPALAAAWIPALGAPRRPVRQWGAILAFRGSALQYTGTQYVPGLRRCKGVQNSPSFQRSLTWPTIAGFCNVCPWNYELFFAIFTSKNWIEMHDSLT